jgi:hypothetical protein
MMGLFMIGKDDACGVPKSKSEFTREPGDQSRRIVNRKDRQPIQQSPRASTFLDGDDSRPGRRGTWGPWAAESGESLHQGRLRADMQEPCKNTGIVQFFDWRELKSGLEIHKKKAYKYLKYQYLKKDWKKNNLLLDKE